MKRDLGYGWTSLNQSTFLQAGTYTFSAYIKATVANITIVVRDATDSDFSKRSFPEISETDFVRLSHVFTIETGGIYKCLIQNETSEGEWWIGGYKLEPGIVKDPIWTPSPEDYLTLVERVTALEEKLGG